MPVGDIFNPDNVLATLESLRAELEKRNETIARLREQRDKAIEALVWCGGSADFGPGGQAREGWVRLCAPLLTAQPIELDERSQEGRGGQNG